MSSISSPKLAPSWENKELDAWLSPAVAAELGDPTSFFDLSFADYQLEQDSSDASVEFNFFDDIDLGSTDTDASVFSSSTLDGPAVSTCLMNISNSISSANATSGSNIDIPAAFHDSGPAQTLQPQLPSAVPQSQRLVHRYRPEGPAISSADLLSIEGRRPRTPPATPQSRSGFNTPKTPRTPCERASRVQKLANSRSPHKSKAMQPSNYFSTTPETPSPLLRGWSERFSLSHEPSLPLSPPPSGRVPQGVQHTAQQQQQQQQQRLPRLDFLGSSAVQAQTDFRRSSASPLQQNFEHSQISPLNPWPSSGGGGGGGGDNDGPNNNIDTAIVADPLTFSPVSPLLDDSDPWTSNAVAHLHNTHFDSFTDNASAMTGGLLIDFGSSDPFATPDYSQAFAPALDGSLADPAQVQGFGERSRASTPSPKTQPGPSASRGARRCATAATHQRKPSSGSTGTHRRTCSSGAGVGKRPGNAGKAGGGAGDMFVNFTPSDSRRILTGVAPSGSSKTKARREKEAREERRRMSEAARRAVQEAGGSWEGLAGELVEV